MKLEKSLLIMMTTALTIGVTAISCSKEKIEKKEEEKKEDTKEKKKPVAIPYSCPACGLG